MLRARSGARYLLIAAICAAAATACGSTTTAPAGSAAPASPAAPKVSLDIKVSGAPGTAPSHWTLQCDPAGGTDPDPAKACAILLKARAPFAPPPKDVACPMILASAKTAKVTGTYFGQRVDTTFVQGGCDLARWAKIGQIFN
jgi:hypothetical protein